MWSPIRKGTNNKRKSEGRERKEQWHNRNCTIISKKINPLQCWGRGAIYTPTSLHHSQNAPPLFPEVQRLQLGVFGNFLRLECSICTLLSQDCASHTVLLVTFGLHLRALLRLARRREASLCFWTFGKLSEGLRPGLSEKASSPSSSLLQNSRTMFRRANFG